MPGSLHAGNYSAVTQVLNTVKKIGTDDPDKIAEALEGIELQRFLRPQRDMAQEGSQRRSTTCT